MTFIGRLKQSSSIWNRWHGEARTGGILHGVHFAWEPGNVYRTLPLTTEQVDVLKTHDSILLEVVSIDTAPVTMAASAKPVAAPGTYQPVNSTKPAGKR